MAKKKKRGRATAPQTENAGFSARRCSLCGKTSNERLGAVTKYVGLKAHRKCFEDAQKRGEIEITKGKGAEHTKKPAKRPLEPAKTTHAGSIPAKKSSASTPQQAATDARFNDLFTDWKSGTQIHALASKMGWKRSKVRRVLIAAAGGKENFRALRQEGAGGTSEPFGGKRAAGGRTRDVISLDDAKTTRLTKLDAKLEGWTHEWLRTSTGNYPILVSPDHSERFVQATPTERADLIYESTTVGIPDVRLKRATESAVAKKAKKETQEVERGEAAIKRTRAAKRAKRRRANG